MLNENKGRVLFSAVILAAALALEVAPIEAQKVPENATGIVAEIPGQPEDYCHMKFPAIDEKTLGTAHPRLKDKSEGDMIDFYGPCSHNPLGNDEVTKQMFDETFDFSSESDGGGD
jgi:hypothetical protein